MTAHRFFPALALALFSVPGWASVTSTVDATGDSGTYTSIQLDAGKPVIAYTQDLTVMLATCTAGCTSAAPTWVIATIGTGQSPSLQLNAGKPAVSYVDSGALKLATCTADCATATPTWATTTVLASGAFFHSLGTSGGGPVLAYTDSTAEEVVFATCTASCDTASPTWARSTIMKRQPSDPLYFLGAVSVAMNGATPWVGYERSYIGGNDVSVATCTANCASAAATWVSSVVDVPMQGHALQLNNGVPAVAYYSYPQLNQDLKYAICTSDCGTATATWTKGIVESAGNTGRGPALQFAGGQPLVSFYDGNGKLKIARCTAGCTATSPSWSFNPVDDGNGSQTSMQVDGSLLMVSYRDPTVLDLRFAVVTNGDPALQLSVASLDFGGQPIGTTSPPQSVTLTNSGALALDIASITAVDPQYLVSHDCGASILSLASCTVTVAFSPPHSVLPPNAKIPVSSQLTIVSNATGSPHGVLLTGTAEKSLVSLYYRAILRRAPDAPGQAFWEGETLRLMGLGANVNETWFAMAQAFFFSAEYQALNRSSSGFVTDLYQTFFNRAPDAAGLAFWVEQRANGMPREVMIAAFMFSAEFTAFSQSIFGYGTARAEVDVVMDFYRGLLGRLPDDDGFAYWVARFRTAQCQGASAVATEAESISSGFGGSSEYGAHGRSNAQFVGDLYNAFLRRGGEMSGVQFWVDEIASGARTRELVRQAFAASPEFQARVGGIVSQGCLP